MSHIGRRALTIPDGVTLTQHEGMVLVKGAKGELSVPLHSAMSFVVTDGVLVVQPKQVTKQSKALQGLTLRLFENAVIGVTDGFTKQLELQGVGYRAAVQGKDLVLSVGYSHPVVITPPDGIEVSVQKNIITISGIDLQQVGQLAANIRRVRPPEPYKGKGIRYVGEFVRRKAGKAAKAVGGA